MLKIVESDKHEHTQLLNEHGNVIMQYDWNTYDREWAYQRCVEKLEEVEAYRAEYEVYGYTKGVRRGMDD